MAILTTVGIREFRDNLSRYLALVQDGGEISVTSHGKPVAEFRAAACQDKPSQKRTVGGLKGQIWMAEDWDEWDDDFLASFEAPLNPEPSKR
jgi:prevent-host-death family protein